MGFLDLFRPKWKHSDAEVRADAARHLDEGDTAILNQIVRQDRDVRVRRIALKKIEDPEVLGEIATRDADEGLRKAAAEKATELLLGAANGPDDEVAALSALEQLARLEGAGKSLVEVARRAALDKVRAQALSRLTDRKDQRLLLEVAKGAEDAQVRRQAGERISDPEVLRDLAIQVQDRDLALAAVEKIDDEAMLDDIARRGRNKAVRNAARDKGGAQKKPAAPAEATPEMLRRARQQQLCRAVEAAAKSSDRERARREIEEARLAWTQLPGTAGGAGEEEQQGRFDRACKQFQDRLDEMRRLIEAREKEQAEKARREQAENEQYRERLTLCETAGQLVHADPAEITARLDEARAAWEKLPPVAGPRRGELEKRFQRACDEALHRVQKAAALKAARGRLFAICIEAEGIPLAGPRGLREADLRFRDLEKEWRRFEAALLRRPGGAAMPARGVPPTGLESSGRPEVPVEGADVPVPKLDPETEEMRTRFYRVHEQINALREGEKTRRAKEETENLVRLEGLCQRLEELAETQDRKKADRALKEAQAAFRGPDAGRVPREKKEALQQRFQAAREKLVVHLQDLRTAEDWKRWANVPNLEQLCVKVEALLALPEDTDPRKLARELRAVQGEWKRVGPAPKEKSETLWQRFKETSDKVHARCQEHFATLDASRAENLPRKEDLCQKAEALCDALDQGETINWKETAEQLKKLQEDWKALGAASKEQKEQSDALWKRFRGACDRFFARRKEQLGKNDELRTQNLAKQEELCARAEALVLSSDWKKAADLIKAYQAEWKAAGAVPREQGEVLWKRFREACDRFFARRKEHFAEIDQQRDDNLKAKEALCVTVEALLLPDAPDTEVPADGQAAVERVRKYMADWKAIGPAPREQADAVWERFRQACNQVIDRARQPQVFEPPPDQPAAGVSRFTNRLPLEGIAELLAGKQPPE